MSGRTSTRRLRLVCAGLLVGAGTVFGFVSSGCGGSRVNECNDVIGIINDGLKKMEEGTVKGDAERIASLKAMADTMAKVDADLAKTKTTIPELKTFSQKYQALAKEIVKNARDMAAAAEANDQEKLAKAKEALDKLSESEGPLVNGINDFCRGG